MFIAIILVVVFGLCAFAPLVISGVPDDIVAKKKSLPSLFSSSYVMGN
jgi:hypothetical protein